MHVHSLLYKFSHLRIFSTVVNFLHQHAFKFAALLSISTPNFYSSITGADPGFPVGNVGDVDLRRGCFLAHLVYQPKSLIQSCFVFCYCIGIGVVLHWHWCWCLCTPSPGTGLYIETSYLVHICTWVPHVCTSNIY